MPPAPEPGCRKITVVDYDAGNVGSVVNICRKAGGEAVVSRDAREIATAAKLILPGVGHFGRAMQRLRVLGLTTALEEAVIGRTVPILGICLGMQLMTRGSEEADVPGLGWIAAETLRLRPGDDPALKVPHMGWNAVEIVRPDPLVEDLPEEPRFYFAHSYHVACDGAPDVLMRFRHGAPLVAAIGRDTICGTQFHPEKSHKFGLALMRNFIGRIPPC